MHGALLLGMGTPASGKTDEIQGLGLEKSVTNVVARVLSVPESTQKGSRAGRRACCF